MQNHGHITTENDFRAVQMTFWYKTDINLKKGGPTFSNLPNFNPVQFCLSMSLLDFSVFYLSPSTVLSRYFDILVNSMTI